MTCPIDLAGERWTHVDVLPDGQILVARLTPSGFPEKVARLAEALP